MYKILTNIINILMQAIKISVTQKHDRHSQILLTRVKNVLFLQMVVSKVIWTTRIWRYEKVFIRIFDLACMKLLIYEIENSVSKTCFYNLLYIDLCTHIMRKKEKVFAKILYMNTWKWNPYMYWKKNFKKFGLEKVNVHIGNNLMEY